MKLPDGRECDVENNSKTACQLLPDEIIFYILSYLPLRSLFKFKCVCKLWNTLFLHPFFLFLRKRNSLASGLLLEEVDIILRDVRSDDLATGFNSSTKICRISQGGLQLEKTHSPLRYRIRCPSLRQWLAIPNPQNPSSCIAMDFVPSFNNQAAHVLKLVSVHEDEENNSLGYEILALGIGIDQNTYHWRAVEKVPNNLQQHDSERRNNGRRKSTKLFFRMGVVAYCIWFVETDNDLDLEVDILDMVNESYIGHTTFPRGFFDLKLSLSSTNPLDWNGRFAFAQLVKDELHVLVLDDYTKLKWAERKRIIKLTFLKQDDKVLITFFACADKSNLFFVRQDKDKKSYCTYNINTGELNTCPLSYPVDPAELVALHVAELKFFKENCRY